MLQVAFTSPQRAWQAHSLFDRPARTAQAYLKSYWDQQFPVDPIAMANAAGVQVFANRSLNGLAGCFSFDDPLKPVIEFNASEPALRQRFTIAHELGHFALNHGPRFRDSTENFSLANDDLIEAEANNFAAELLMPAAVVNGLISKYDITDLDRLAGMFKNSTVAMKYCLKKP